MEAEEAIRIWQRERREVGKTSKWKRRKQKWRQRKLRKLLGVWQGKKGGRKARGHIH